VNTTRQSVQEFLTTVLISTLATSILCILMLKKNFLLLLWQFGLNRCLTVVQYEETISYISPISKFRNTPSRTMHQVNYAKFMQCKLPLGVGNTSTESPVQILLPRPSYVLVFYLLLNKPSNPRKRWKLMSSESHFLIWVFFETRYKCWYHSRGFADMVKLLFSGSNNFSCRL